jgi:thiol-disulfide isomerase/thioredoxin
MQAMEDKRIGIWAAAGFLVLVAILAMPALTADKPAKGDAALQVMDFTLEDINPESATFGQEVSLSDVYSERGVVLNFVASWCGPCRMELPILESMHKDDAATILVVAADENGAGTENVKIIIERAGATMPVLFASDEAAERLFEFYTYQVIPATYLINREGELKAWHTGMRSRAKLEREVSKYF